MEPDPIPTDKRPEWLRALTEKSWNLELVISGAAIFLANYLPAAVDDMLRYYLENLVMDEDFKKISLPLLVYSFMKVVAWLLILTFVVHFVMRAFWAGVVGHRITSPPIPHSPNHQPTSGSQYTSSARRRSPKHIESLFRSP
jgi:hypothetical protein